eukprot:TRINITY_DN436_c0_g1_i1.p1 TRINITY_DN436_c0_g1~~TRINITY_DN436_c0_g1_i1.p1  ORF type:complete len:198 (-),score=54.77 TRINITY_DN436_c0_g1_i1:89-682(-)
MSKVFEEAPLEKRLSDYLRTSPEEFDEENFDSLCEHIEDRINISLTDAKYTLLHEVVNGDKKHLFQRLIKNEYINVNCQSGLGYGPIHRSVRTEKHHFTRMFVEHKNIDINLQDNFDRTPIFEAVENGCEECIRILIEHPDIDLHRACNGGKTCVEYLMSNKEQDKSKIIKEIFLPSPYFDLSKEPLNVQNFVKSLI